ncbi:MAG: GDP-mannose 4,6-dehydratase [Candidatus Methanofastidiosia archaeon]
MIFITGGAGFLGSHLIDRLLERGERVLCLDNFDPYYDPEIKKRNIQNHLDNKDFILIKGDVRDEELLKKLFKTYEIKKVVHLAAKAGVRVSLKIPHPYFDVNVGGTLSLLEILKKNEIDNFVFGSSSSVYGSTQKVPFSENYPCDKPISPYGASKRSAELLCFTYSQLYNIPTTILRFFTVYGPRQRPEMAIHKFTRLINSRREIQMYGDGSSKRVYTYIEDIISGILSVLEKRFSYEIFNLGNSKPVELSYLISLIERNLGKGARIKPQEMQPGDPEVTFANIEKARKMLSYNPKFEIEEGVERFYEWYLEKKG